MSAWREAVIGYGLERVPPDLAADLVCAICGVREHPRYIAVLYTTERTATDGTRSGLQRLLERLRQRCYCKTHALQMYGAQ